jgi:hypothetical protein
MRKWLCGMVLLATLTTRAWSQHKHDWIEVQIPSGSTPVARTSVDEIRAFPEMASTAVGAALAKDEKVLGTEATDSLYETDAAYDATVAFFDRQFKQRGYELRARTVTNTATAWTIRRPDHTTANVVVRVTSPRITFEIAQALPRKLPRSERTY